MRLANVRNNSRLVSSVMRSVLGVPGAALLEELKGERRITARQARLTYNLSLRASGKVGRGVLLCDLS